MEKNQTPEELLLEYEEGASKIRKFLEAKKEFEEWQNKKAPVTNKPAQTYSGAKRGRKFKGTKQEVLEFDTSAQEGSKDTFMAAIVDYITQQNHFVRFSELVDALHTTKYPTETRDYVYSNVRDTLTRSKSAKKSALIALPFKEGKNKSIYGLKIFTDGNKKIKPGHEIKKAAEAA